MIILIGGTGFIGKHLCTLLHGKSLPAVTFSRNPDSSFLNTHAPSIKGFELTDNFDTEHANIIKQASTIIYLASESIPSLAQHDISKEISTNIASATNILGRVAAINSRINIIYLSSGGTVYGPNHSKPIPETAGTNPITPYAFGKVAIEQYIKYLSNTTNVTHTIFRASNPVGKWHSNPQQGFIGASLNRLRNGQTIKIYGDGLVIRDYLDADELSEAILKSIESPERSKNKLWNIGSGKGYCLNELSDIIQKVTQKEINIERLQERPVDLSYNVLDCSLIKKELNWQTSLNIEQIIENSWTQQ